MHKNSHVIVSYCVLFPPVQYFQAIFDRKEASRRVSISLDPPSRSVAALNAMGGAGPNAANIREIKAKRDLACGKQIPPPPPPRFPPSRPCVPANGGEEVGGRPFISAATFVSASENLQGCSLALSRSPQLMVQFLSELTNFDLVLFREDLTLFTC